MEIKFIINLVIALAIFVVLLVNYVKHHKEERTKKIIMYFLLIGVLYLIDATFSFLWAFSILDYVESDYLFIRSLMILLQSFFIFVIIYCVTCNKKLYYFFGAYVMLFFLILLLGLSFMNFFILASYLFMLLLFIGITVMKREYKKSGYYGIAYALLSLILYVLFFFGLGGFCVLTFFSNVFFIVFVIFFYRNLEENPPDVVAYPEQKKRHYLAIFLSHFVFMLVLINFVFVGTIVLHEFGHLTVASFYDCEYGKIVYDGTYPHTEVICPQLNSNNQIILLSGMFFPLLVALILLFVGGKFLREIALLLVGFNLVISFKDFIEMGISDNLVMFFVILGIFLAIGGIILLARSKTEEYLYSLGGS